MRKRGKLVIMEELFTKEELESAREIFNEYKGEPRYVGQLKVSDEIVKPKLDDIAKYTGNDNSPEYWACCLAHYVTGNGTDNAATHH
jgi:hypothetical protein